MQVPRDEALSPAQVVNGEKLGSFQVGGVGGWG